MQNLKRMLEVQSGRSNFDMERPLKWDYTLKDGTRSPWSQQPQELEPAERSEVPGSQEPRELDTGVEGVPVAFRRV